MGLKIPCCKCGFPMKLWDCGDFVICTNPYCRNRRKALSVKRGVLVCGELFAYSHKQKNTNGGV